MKTSVNVSATCGASENRSAGPYPQEVLGGSDICISNKLPSVADTAGPGTIL